MTSSWAKGLKLIILAMGMGLVFHSCIVVDQEYSKLPPGIWRGSLQLERPAIHPKADLLEEGLTGEESGGVYLPFLFEVQYDETDELYIEFINGEERIRIDHISYGWDKRIAKDTFTIFFDVYDSYLTGISFEGIMEGTWVRSNRENYEIPFVAYYGEDKLFGNQTEAPVTDLSGQWACRFEIETDHPYPAIGEFNQSGSQISGTFRTETGDYRYLSGVVIGNNLKMSVFDGAHAFLFEAKYKQDSLIGTFYSGHRYKCLWSGKLDEHASLEDPDSLTYAVSNQPFDFAFPDVDGQIQSIEDYSAPIKIIQIMGTWCPNCRDETKFLVDYFKENPTDQVEVIALAFESYRDAEKSRQAIRRYKEFFQMDYDILHAGYRDKKEASETVPILSEIISFPTLLFLDESNRIRKIHTGFNGPATSQYQAFVDDFSSTLQELMNE